MAFSASRKSFAGIDPKDEPVAYDERSVILNGHRTLVICGEIHYPRSTRAMWPLLLERSKSLGLNMISTYVFWNVHETSRGNYNFTGERDLGHYLDLCHQNGLSVFLWVGPYICAEWNYGGFPSYSARRTRNHHPHHERGLYGTRGGVLLQTRCGGKAASRTQWRSGGAGPG
ncbi:beta-galactosidase [Tunturiibacter gelidiferens]|uniref:beta-galactosidase n=1 Tax=Tunturiibacter gelidiferens TaxID=3069689 RepID=UPI003C12C28E